MLLMELSCVLKLAFFCYANTALANKGTVVCTFYVFFSYHDLHKYDAFNGIELRFKLAFFRYANTALANKGTVVCTFYVFSSYHD